MSSDNGLYILATRGKLMFPEYRVTHAQAIENINWNPDESGFNLLTLWQYFKDSNVYFERDKAWSKARAMHNEIMEDDYCPIVEYGICEINALNIEFPSEQPPCCKNPMLTCIDGTYQCYNCGNYFYNEEE